jgi:radical SAM superfamily enzyme YgiQ (UPF0313 family)
MRIALCLCPQWSLITPSFALGSLSSALEQDGHETEQIDLNLLSAYYAGKDKDKYWRFSHKENAIYDGKVFQANFVNISKQFDKFWDSWIDKMSKFDVVCFTTYSSNITTTDYIARKLKQINPKIQIWYGGPYCWQTESGGLIATQDGKQKYREFVDVGCGLNEGEVIIKDLAKQYSKYKNYNGVKGVWVWDKQSPSFPTALPPGRSGRVPVFNGNPNKLVNMNELDVPMWSEETLKLYEKINKKDFFMLPIQTARGCTFKCTFCSETRLYRYKSAEKVRDDIDKLYKQYGYKDFWFVDSLMNGSMKQFEQVINLLDELPYDIKWGGYGRTSKKMTDKLMKKAKSSGMNWLEVGVESGVPKILGLMEKGQTPEVIKDVIKNSYNNGVGFSANWIPAFAKENSMDFLQNLMFLYECRDYFDKKSLTDGKNLRFVSRVNMMMPVEVHKGTPMDIHKSHYSISDDKFIDDWVSNDYKNNILNRNIRGHLTHLMLNLLDVQNTTMQDIDNNIKLNKMIFGSDEKDITNIDYNDSFLKFANKQKELDKVENKEQNIKQSIIDDIKVWIWALHKIKGDFIVDFEFTENFIPQLLKDTQFKYKVYCKSYDDNYKIKIYQSLLSDDLKYEDYYFQSGNFAEKGYKLKSKNLNYVDSQRYDKYKVSFPRTEMTNQY